MEKGREEIKGGITMKRTKAVKRIFGILIMAAMAVLMTGTTFAAKTDIAIYINSNVQAIPSEMGAPFIDNQARTQVPLRFVSEKLGHTIKWDAKKQEVSIDNNKVVVKIGDFSVKTPNGNVTMDTAPVVINGRTYVPIRFIAECLGHKVDYKYAGGVNCILITTVGTPGAVETPVVDENVNPEYKPGDAPTYTPSPSEYGYNETTKHWVDWDIIGSNTENTTVRSTGGTWFGDLGYLNSLVGKYGYGLAGDGQLTIGGKNAHLETQTGNSSTYVAIGYISGQEYREVCARGWVTKNNTNPTEGQVVQQNILIESIKYFSASTKDGEAIVAYVDKYINKSQYPPFGKDMTFGSTSVRFKKREAGWGFYVIFNDAGSGRK